MTGIPKVANYQYLTRRPLAKGICRFWEGEEGSGFATPRSPLTLSICTQPPTGKTPGSKIEITLFDKKLAHRHLLWHLVFRGVTTMEWFILHNELETQTLRLPREHYICLVGALSLSSKTRKCLDRWTSRTKPLHRALKATKPHESVQIHKEETFLERFSRELLLPQKGLPVADLYNVKIKEIPISTAREVSRIGVGYKDKGSRAPQHVCKLPGPELRPEPFPYFVQARLVDGWKSWQRLET